ncbi:MAG: DUF3237 family protein [Burkholderiales bacterium]|nr:DUF3237 family protein [Burkholderiales bacterium]
MSQLQSSPLFDISLALHPPHDLGVTPLGTRRIVPVSGGMFTGERLKGVVLPNAGADWILMRRDGSVQLDVRLTLKTDDDALIFMTYRGIRHSSPEVAQQLARGEKVDPAAYYFRTCPVFETSYEKYEWLNNIICVAVGERLASEVKYKVFEIL